MSRHHRGATGTALRKARVRIAATLPAACVNQPCRHGGFVFPDQAWDVGHIIDASAGGSDALDNLGPAHVECNRRDGGKLGAAITNARRAATSTTNRRMRPW
ncbi:HNH endonuclease [Curtobacterium aurantiacum]|uniref:HNH endonuclease n=1 Tax=Curtobacterium aurantiacum TaxID=3236919 RepID=UPI001BDF953A|nr:HNH endonuclease signature motif containing protein [Curtobacterium flaccumfaciens]MBT1676012.1 HNH endonuclease [Curtobacterium flaccumfaciens pv. flaccumfaciens]